MIVNDSLCDTIVSLCEPVTRMLYGIESKIPKVNRDFFIS